MRSAMLSIPAWEDSVVPYTSVHDDVDWMDSEFLLVAESTPPNYLLSSAYRFGRVKSLRLDYPWKAQQLAVCKILSSAPQLVVLDMSDVWLSRDVMDAFVLVLSALPNLQQLRVVLETDADQPLDLFFENLAKLPLTALGLHLRFAAPHSCQLLFDTLEKMQRTLVCLELGCYEGSFFDAYCKALPRCGRQLRSLHMTLGTMSKEKMDVFCSILDELAHLRHLAIRPDDSESLASLTSYLMRSKDSCPIRKMQIVFGWHVRISHGDLLCFFHALKCLRVFWLKCSFSLALMESGLVDEGWLSEYFPVDSKPLPPDFHTLVLRNKRRHLACMHACVALIVMRKRKQRVLALFPYELVITIVRFMWETRNRDVWDMN